MVVGNLVREIVRTYELPPKLESKVVEIAIDRIVDLGLSGYDGIYREVSYLVEKFQLPFTESFALRLDSRLKYDSNTTFHGIIGIDDPGLSSKFEYDKSKVGITVSDVIDLLGGRLYPRSLGIIRQLLDNSGSTPQLNISPEDLLLAIPQIQEILE